MPNPEEFKAWSQNLGHQGVLTTLYSYGDVPDYRQAELIKKLIHPGKIKVLIWTLVEWSDLQRDKNGYSFNKSSCF
jgi:hypothetical protein